MTTALTETERLESLSAELDAAEVQVRGRLAKRRRISGRFIAGRLTTFAVGVVGFFAAVGFADGRWASLCTLPSIVLFVLLVLRHRPVKDEIARLERLLELMARKRARMAEKPVTTAVDGELRDPALGEGASRHWTLPVPVREDLALFEGRRHLFGIAAGATSSRLGPLEIARRLIHSDLDPSSIESRARAARALLQAKRTRHRLEQVFATFGPSDEARSFARDGDLELPDEGRIGLLRIVTAVNVAALGAAIFLEWNPGLLIVTLVSIVAARVFRRSLARTPSIRGGFVGLRRTLKACGAVHGLLERDAGLDGGPELRSIRDRIAALVTGEPPLDSALGRLAALGVYQAGLLYVVFNWITLWDLHHLIPLARFGRERRSELLAALDALGALEAATALADLAEEQRGWAWPEVHRGDRPVLRLDDVRHPGLASEAAVPNSIELEGGRGVCVLTGSNMTGKSTFLKACGSALLLAQAGGPVAAAAMRWTPMRLLSDVNVRDSLDDGRSYFAVEVGRIREVVALAVDEPFLLALLDEMFRGTNTHEKVAAGIEVTRWLAERECLALVATHDHELTALAAEVPGGGIRNYHFTESIRDGKMTFDYVLRDGPATSRNAIRVLEHEGFPDELVRRALTRSEEHGRQE